METPSKLGLSLQRARKRLEDLLKERGEVLGGMLDKGYVPLEAREIEEFDVKTLAERLASIDEEIREVRELYNMNLLESLDSESAKLNKLTLTLTILTALLALLTGLLVLRTFFTKS